MLSPKEAQDQKREGPCRQETRQKHERGKGKSNREEQFFSKHAGGALTQGNEQGSKSIVDKKCCMTEKK